MSFENCHDKVDIETASSLIEVGLGASRRNDRDLARIYLALAARFYDRGKNTKCAEQVRAMAEAL